jgi:hypothetical protein
MDALRGSRGCLARDGVLDGGVVTSKLPIARAIGDTGEDAHDLCASPGHADVARGIEDRDDSACALLGLDESNDRVRLGIPGSIQTRVAAPIAIADSPPSVNREVSMFQLRTEKYFVDFGDGRRDWFDKPVMVREDGVKLMEIGGSRDGQTYFIYTDKDVSLKIVGQRYDTDLNLTDTWSVYLDIALQYAPQDQRPKLTFEKAREIAANMAAALRAWPPTKLTKDIPIRRVRFLMERWKAWNPAWGEVIEQ